jgi:cytochrome P450
VTNGASYSPIREGHKVVLCIGLQLARLELKIFFEEALKRLPQMELVGVPTRLRSNFLHGFISVPVSFSR